MATLTVQQRAWVWAWEQTEIALGTTHPSPYTRRREKIETISYPPLGTSILVIHFYILFELVKITLGIT